MNISYRFLKESDYPEIYRTFLEAFSDYALSMKYMNEAILYNRALKNGIDFECSAGAFVEDKMTGFTMVGIDDWQGIRSAFDIATGIVKSCRGQGVARSMFEVIVPRLKENGVKQFLLEVLQENEPAIKAYTKIGFQIIREFECFQLESKGSDLQYTARIDIEIRETDKHDLSGFQSFYDWHPSWENSIASILRIPDEVHTFIASFEGKTSGTLVYYPGLHWIMAIAVDPAYRRKGIATHLFNHLFTTIPMSSRVLKLNNVQHDDHDLITFLEKVGFEKYTSQYEMSLQL